MPYAASVRPAYLRAGQIQPRSDPARVLAERAERPIAALVRAGFDAIIGELNPTSLGLAIQANRFDALWDHLALERLAPALRPALNRIALTHDQSAIEASLGIADAPVFKAAPSKLKTPAVIPLTYDPLDPATVAAQQAQAAQIVAGVEANAQATAEHILSQGLSAGVRPAQIARQLRDTLGMTLQEATAIQNYRAALNSGTLSPLNRALRDRRFDAATRRGGLDEAQIDRMVERYAARYRAFRAMRLARTESLRAANQGRKAAWTQYAGLTGEGVRRFWLTAGDELVCAICAPIPGLNPEGIGLDERYATPIGPLDAPPDPHPVCRCTERFVRFAG
jgi:hypothetical protein